MMQHPKHRLRLSVNRTRAGPCRVLKNKHQAVSQGRYKLEARGLRLEAQKNQPPSARLPASSLQLPADCM